MLTDVKIRNINRSKPCKLTDSHGLYLEITKSGSKLWRYRYRLNGKENTYAIGSYGEIGLEAARRARDNARALVKAGTHPSRQRETAKLMAAYNAASTFAAVAAEWQAAHRSRWSDSYAQNVDDILQKHILPSIGALPITEIQPPHILTFLRKIESSGKHPTALLARQRCSSIFRYAMATLRTDRDPTMVLRGAIASRPTKHHLSLSHSQLINLLAKIEATNCERTTVIAMKLLALLFPRPSELREAVWAEIDFEKAVWRIPAHRMKMRAEHVIPLPAQAIVMLTELRQLTGHRAYLFPNLIHLHKSMGNSTLNVALKRIGYNGRGTIGFSVHGFRATASTMLNEMGVHADLIERQLAHSPRNSTRATYNHATWLEERRAMLTKWGAHIGV